MNINFIKIRMQLQKGLKAASRYSFVAITIVAGGLLALVIQVTGNALTAEASEEAFVLEIATFKNAVFDEEVIQEVVELSANDVEIRSKLPQDRDNPFLPDF